MIFADKVRAHIMKEKFISEIHANTPRTSKDGKPKCHAKSELPLVKIGEKPNKFVDKNNMEISVFHTSVCQGRTNNKDAGQFKIMEEGGKKDPDLSVNSKANENDFMQKKRSELEMIKSDKSIRRSDNKYSEQNALDLKMKERNRRMVDVCKDIYSFKSEFLKTKNAILDQTNKLKQSLKNGIKEYKKNKKRDFISALVISSTSSILFIQKNLKKYLDNLNIVFTDSILRPKSKEIRVQDVSSQTNKKDDPKQINYLPEYLYTKTSKITNLSISTKNNQNYTYQKRQSFEIQIKKETKTNLELRNLLKNKMLSSQQKSLQNISNVSKENNSKFSNTNHSILGKRNFENSLLKTDERYRNEKSIVNLNKLSVKNTCEEKNKIPEFKLVPKTKKKKIIEKKKRKDSFENSVQIRNLVEVNSSKRNENKAPNK